MFTENKNPRARGRPTGRTAQGIQMRERLYRKAIEMFIEHGYEATTLREIARRSEVSMALIYRYFPNKRALVLEFHDELSLAYAKRALHLPKGRWVKRFLFAVKTSLEVLSEHREVLIALTPVLVGNGQEGLFSKSTAFSRKRVRSVFEEVVLGAEDAFSIEESKTLGRVLYVIHLLVLLGWLFDKSPSQRATESLLKLIESGFSWSSVLLQFEWLRNALGLFDRYCEEALFETDNEIPLEEKP